MSDSDAASVAETRAQVPPDVSAQRELIRKKRKLILRHLTRTLSILKLMYETGKDINVSDAEAKLDTLLGHSYFFIDRIIYWQKELEKTFD